MKAQEMQYIEELFDMSEEEPGAELCEAYLPLGWSREFRTELDRRLRDEGLTPGRIGYSSSLGDVIIYSRGAEYLVTPGQYRNMMRKISA